MAKIKLGTPPESFTKEVSCTLLDGSIGTIECEFVYRTRTEYGKFVDELFGAIDETPPEDGKFSMEKVMQKNRDKGAEYLRKAIKRWNLDRELDRDALLQLSDEVPAMVSAIVETYRTACEQGRLGN